MVHEFIGNLVCFVIAFIILGSRCFDCVLRLLSHGLLFSLERHAKDFMVAGPMFLFCRCSRLLKQVVLFLLWLRSVVIQGSGCYVRHSHTAPGREEEGGTQES